MKTLIQNVILGFPNDTYLTDQVKWELLKCEIASSQLIFLKDYQKIPVNYKETWKLKLEI